MPGAQHPELPPGPEAPRSVQTLASWTRSIPLFERCRARYGKRFTLRLLRTPRFVHLSDPAEVKEIFTAPPDVKKPVEIGGFRYPEGICLAANGYLIHHDPAIYPDPYEFRPERFLDEPPGTYTWIPFGGGRRRCLSGRASRCSR